MPAPAPPPPAQDPPAPFDILNPPPPKPISPEDDPNLKMAELIAKRTNRRAGKEEPKEKLTDDEKVALEATHGTATGDKKTEDAIARFLNFRTKPAAKKPEEKPDEKAAEEKPTEEERQKDEAEPKTIVSKKKPQQQPVLDTARIVSEATTAATTAAMKGLREQQQKPSAAPEDSLVGRDRHEYEVAQYLAQTNPKYRDAPQIVLSQIKKANAYAARWEAQNPGKTYNPEDEEHADFHDSLDDEKPWTQEEFEDAKVDRRVKAVSKEENQALRAELEELKKAHAHNELREDVQNVLTGVAGALSKGVSDEIYEIVSKPGGDQVLKEKEPIIHEAISAILNAIQPVTEALVMLEDPKRRVAFDPENPAHAQYANFFHEAESRFIGQQDENGKMFARRADYEKMSAGEMSRHWYLTTQMVGAELVGDASKAIAERIETEKNRLKKFAEANGYVREARIETKENKTVSSNREESPPSQNGSPAPFKPASPPSPSGVAIDNNATTPTDPVSRFSQKLSEILNRR